MQRSHTCVCCLFIFEDINNYIHTRVYSLTVDMQSNFKDYFDHVQFLLHSTYHFRSKSVRIICFRNSVPVNVPKNLIEEVHATVINPFNKVMSPRVPWWGFNIFQYPHPLGQYLAKGFIRLQTLLSQDGASRTCWVDIYPQTFSAVKILEYGVWNQRSFQSTSFFRLVKIHRDTKGLHGVFVNWHNFWIAFGLGTITFTKDLHYFKIGFAWKPDTIWEILGKTQDARFS